MVSRFVRDPRGCGKHCPPFWLSAATFLASRIVHLIEDRVEDWRRLDTRVDDVTREIVQLARQDQNCKRLQGVPGVGPLTASAVVAAIGNGAAFAKGRDFSAWLGLVPKQLSTGGRTILGSISRCGNRYLRTLFVQGARSVLLATRNLSRHELGRWLATAAPRLHRNVLAIALANKLARIAWSVLHNGRGYEVNFKAQVV